jgi:ABC-type transport system involved in multi-copper enzyme maturation permease subunit
VKVRRVFARLNRAQQTLPFKVIASVVLLALAGGLFAAYIVSVSGPAAREARAMMQAAEAEAQPAPGGPAEPTDDERELRKAIDASQRVFAEIAARRASPANVAIGLLAVTVVGLVSVWLGLGLTYLGMALVGGLVIVPLWLLSGTAWAEGRSWSGTTTVTALLRGASLLLTGLLVLSASFMTLMQGARVLLAGAGPVMAVARNVLIEAVRMKVSLVFIVIMVFALSALPLVLDPTTPLRYRVQSFLQYGTGGSFWVIAVLTLFFSASSVAFEQRDRQIWQTMTKPVAAWQYVLGKWLGVVTLNAVLLAVCCAGVFLFTEYLRKQPAEGEEIRVVTSAQQGISRDRMLLETQVLTARSRVEADGPVKIDNPDFLREVKAYIDGQRARDPQFAVDDAHYRQVLTDLHKSYSRAFRAIPVGEFRDYWFSGLSAAKEHNVPLTLRYKVDSGSNEPSAIYKISFMVGDVPLEAQQVGLGQAHTLTLYPTAIDEEGRVGIRVFNGELVIRNDGTIEDLIPTNPDMISFPDDGLELYYTAGTYQGNFFRVAGVLWVKLAFLAMLAIAASTFLSFPVACLIAFSVFIGAEGTGFLKEALQYYSAADEKGNVNLVKVVVRAIGLTVAWMFGSYHELKPTMRLVDGRLLTWSSMAWGCGVLLAWTAGMYALAVGIFRRRELATYSGQ